MGLTSASLGISGLVFSQINDRYFKSKADDSSTFHFLLFVGIVVSITAFLGSFVLGPIHSEETIDISADLVHRKDDLIAQNLNNHSYTQSISSFSTSSTQLEDDDESRPLLSKNAIVVSADNLNHMKKQMIIQEETGISGIAFFSDPVGFALALSLLVILGLGYVYLANIGQLLVSLSPIDLTIGEAQHLRNFHVSVFSIANCGSRAAFGTLSDVLKRAGVHRLWFFWAAAVGLVISMSFLISFVTTADELISCTIMTAIVYGIAFGVAPATISEFGQKVNPPHYKLAWI